MTIKKYAVPAGVTSITLPDGSVLIPVEQRRGDR